MNSPPAKARTRRSYRERIRQVIADRIVLGKPLTTRAILADAGGGSTSTVVEELAKAERPAPATLVGRGATSLPQRIVALEDALNASVAREQVLGAENQVLKSSLVDARTTVDKLLTQHQDSQRLLLQGVDDLRQMVKAGQGGMPHAAARPSPAAADPDGDAVLWQARHDQLLGRYIELEKKFRGAVSRLNEHGLDWD